MLLLCVLKVVNHHVYVLLHYILQFQKVIICFDDGSNLKLCTIKKYFVVYNSSGKNL